MGANKWTLEIKSEYKVGDKTITRTDIQAIPPTSGDRIDIIGTSGKYYYNITKEEFYKREAKVNPPSRKGKTLIDDNEYTPRIINDEVEIIINIKNGEINISSKF